MFAVEWVDDGDTVHLANGQKVRILEVNSPELAHDGNPEQCGGQAARSALERLLLHEHITLRADPREADHDRYGRLLRYIDVHGTDAGLWMIQHGHATEYHPRSANAGARADAYRHAEQAAKQANVGQWAVCSAREEYKR